MECKILAVTLLLLTVFFVGHLQATEVLIDGGFEASSGQGLQLSWTSADFGEWGVGDAFGIVGAEDGITPLGGNNMLVHNTDLGVNSNVYQLIDISSYAADTDAGNVTADLSAFYNSVAVTSVGLNLLGWASEPTDFSVLLTLVGSVNELTLDADVGTWEEVALSVLIPTGIRYLAFGIHEPSGIPFAYVDNTSLDLTVTQIPLPGALTLFTLGLVGLGVRRRTR